MNYPWSRTWFWILATPLLAVTPLTTVTMTAVTSLAQPACLNYWINPVTGRSECLDSNAQVVPPPPPPRRVSRQPASSPSDRPEARPTQRRAVSRPTPRPLARRPQPAPRKVQAKPASAKPTAKPTAKPQRRAQVSQRPKVNQQLRGNRLVRAAQPQGSRQQAPGPSLAASGPVRFVSGTPTNFLNNLKACRSYNYTVGLKAPKAEIQISQRIIGRAQGRCVVDLGIRSPEFPKGKRLGQCRLSRTGVNVFTDRWAYQQAKAIEQQQWRRSLELVRGERDRLTQVGERECQVI